MEAIDFINAIARESDKLNHHPDIYNSYTDVNIEISTHKIGELSELDFVLGDEALATKTGVASVIRCMVENPLEDGKSRLIKNTVIEYGVEYLEKSAFKAVLYAARECKDEKTANLCEKLIGDEAETAEYLDQSLSDVVVEHVNRETVFKKRVGLHRRRRRIVNR